MGGRSRETHAPLHVSKNDSRQYAKLPILLMRCVRFAVQSQTFGQAFRQVGVHQRI